MLEVFSSRGMMLSLRPHPAWQPLWIPRAPYPVVCLFVSVCPVIARRDPSNDNYSAWGSAAPNSHNNKNNAGYQRECRSKPVVVIGVVVLLPSHLYGTDLNNKGDCLGGSCRLETIKDDRYKYQKERKRERDRGRLWHWRIQPRQDDGRRKRAHERASQ